jgi:hypothetical protein
MKPTRIPGQAGRLVRASRGLRAALIAAPVLVAAAASVLAQQPASIDGNWTVEMVFPNGNMVSEIDLTIEGSGGAWQSKARNKFNACIGLRSPVDVVESGPERLRLNVMASRALAGCPDASLTLTRDRDRLVGVAGPLGAQDQPTKVTAIRKP